MDDGSPDIGNARLWLVAISEELAKLAHEHNDARLMDMRATVTDVANRWPAHLKAEGAEAMRESVIEALREGVRSDSGADSVMYVSEVVGFIADDDPVLIEETNRSALTSVVAYTEAVLARTKGDPEVWLTEHETANLLRAVRHLAATKREHPDFEPEKVQAALERAGDVILGVPVHVPGPRT